MKILCDLRQSQLTYRSMRFVIIIGFFCALAPAAFAQAADPNAIDLSGKMDTIARGTGGSNWEFSLSGFLNVGLQNKDNWEDFEVAGSITKMRFGGPLIFDTTNNPEFGDNDPNLYGDFDGDGIGDIISHGALFFKGKTIFPYFDFTPNSGFATHDKFAGFYFPHAMDFDDNGTTDVIVYNDDNSIRLYKGGVSFGTKKYQFADDSIQFPSALYSMEVGKFGAHLKPMIISSNGPKTYLIKQTGNAFSQDSVILISDSANGGITVTNLYATDITGDGITDLIVSDGTRIYIFKGSDDFGSYPLTPQTAFYTIRSPRLTDFGTWNSLSFDFGNGMKACGDLTGSGIPYLAVNTDINEAGYYKGFIFFYAGGKALDSLYDAVIGDEDQGLGGVDTLHSIDSSGRTVCLINDFRDKNFGLFDLDFLMSRGCEKIPHKTNPKMVTIQSRITEGFEVSCFPALANKFTKVQISSDKYSEAAITIFNLLGQVIQTRKIVLDPGGNTEFFNTTDWTNGTYIGSVESSSGVRSIKFLVNH